MNLQQTESFVPLTTAPAAGGQREFRATVISAAGHTKAFQSLEAQAVSVTGAAPINGKICEPKVTIQREGDRIVTIRVQCSCGQVMDLSCVYDSAAKPA